MTSDKIPKELLRYPAQDYLDCDPYSGDESDLECRKVAVVKTIFAQICTIGARKGSNKHPPGTVMWSERAKVDGQFQSNYVCLPHIAMCLDMQSGVNCDPYDLSCEQAAKYAPDKEQPCE